MRTIKFRGKRLDNGGWVYGDLIHGQGCKSGKTYILPQCYIYPAGCSELDGWNVIPETVGQFTGLLDKNGKEIYEGDVVYFTVFDCYDNDTQYTGMVKFSEGEWQIWCSIDSEFYGYDGAFYLYHTHCHDCDIRIIGNIHDNHKLLKTK